MPHVMWQFSGRTLVSRMLAALLYAFSICCANHDATGPTVPGIIAHVSVSPRSVLLTVGGTAPLLAGVVEASGKPASPPIGWRSLDPSIVSVDVSGTVTAVAPGATTIVVSSSGAADDSATVDVSAAPVPTLPTLFNATAVVPAIRTVPVRRGADLQAALNAAQPGRRAGVGRGRDVHRELRASAQGRAPARARGSPFARRP